MRFAKSNYSHSERRECGSVDRFLEDALRKAMVSGGSIVVFLPKSGKKLVIK